MTLNALHADAALPSVPAKYSTRTRDEDVQRARVGSREWQCPKEQGQSGLKRTRRDIKPRLVCATMYASLARWFQMGGTGLSLSLLWAERVTQRRPKLDTGIHKLIINVSTLERSWML
jgi:hypothetical protein